MTNLIARSYVRGGWYLDSLDTGERCVLHPSSHVETHLGDVPLPPGVGLGLLQLRCTNVGGFRFAGASWTDTDAIYEWSAATGTFTVTRTPIISVNPVIYDRQGKLWINGVDRIVVDGVERIPGAMGFRALSLENPPAFPGGRPLSSDETVLFGELSQWIPVGDDLYLGQGHPDWAREAAWVYDARTARYHELERGRCTFIRGNAVGDRVAISIVKPDPHPERTEEDTAGGVLLRATHAQLRALPVVTFPVDPPEDPVFQKCEVTVDAFTLTPAAQLSDGIVAKFHDRMNARGAYVTVWVENGSCRMSIDYPGAAPGLKGETGARRPVR